MLLVESQHKEISKVNVDNVVLPEGWVSFDIWVTYWAFSALTLLVEQQEGYPACEKPNGGMLVWLSVWVRCRFAYDPADATATHYLLLQYIQIDFTFLIPAHLGSHGQRAVI